LSFKRVYNYLFYEAFFSSGKTRTVELQELFYFKDRFLSPKKIGGKNKDFN